MGIIATGLQVRQKDCYATSARCQLTLRTNAEEYNSVFGPNSDVVKAGFDAPTVAPSGNVTGGGSLSGYYVYAYVYASTKYPFVESDVEINGEEWPRSNPSPMSSVQDASAGSKTVNLTLTKTTRTDVDKIVIYRTQSASTSAAAQALADAGTLYYIGQATNNGIAGTVAFSDTGLTDTGEELELDNYPAPTCEYGVFDGTYWWVAGECSYDAEVTLNGTAVVEVTSEYNLFSGRDGQFATFDGVTSGGYDGAGTFYAKITAPNEVTLYRDADLTVTLAVAFSGTTTMHLRGFTNILYRSKALNPFSWGITEAIFNQATQTTADVPQTFTLNLGGGNVTAMAVSPNGKRLVIHFDQPQRTIALDLEFADSEQFGLTTAILDNTNSVTAHFTLFNGQWGNNPVLFGLDTYNGQVLICDGYEQHTIADEFGHFIEELPRDNRATKFFHGCYDSHTDLNCFWTRYYETDERNNIMLWVSATTQLVGWSPDFDVLSSCQFLDDESGERMVIGGTELGLMGRLLCPGKWFNWGFRFGWDNVSNQSPSPGSGFLILTWNDVYGDPVFITQTSPSTGVFRVSALSVVSSAEIVLVDAGTGLISDHQVDHIEQISSSTWEVTLTAPYPTSGDGYTTAMHPKYYGRSWVLMTGNTPVETPALTPTFLKWAFDDYTVEAAPKPIFALEYTLEVGATELVDVSSTLLSGQVVYLGGIPCTFRSYFNLGHPTISKKADEVWMTGRQFYEETYTGENYTYPAVRYYVQYENDWVAPEPFGLIRQAAVADVRSIVFTNNSQVPSYQPKSFGMEFMECSQNDFQLFDFTIKVSETSP